MIDLKVTCTLIRKEFTAFFISSMGWITLSVWLLVTGLMVWVFGGDYNILDGEYATLRPLFRLSPVLMTLIIPALTMRSYAEERRTGTWESLISHPVTPMQIGIAKFFAAWGVSLLALLFTLFYVITLSLLALQGLDAGEITGGYVGLFLLSGAFVAIGLFCSSLTRNQLTAYLAGVFLCFLSYYGFALIASLSQNGIVHSWWEQMGMAAHYEPMTRGVLFSGGLIHFISVIFLFLFLAGRISGQRYCPVWWTKWIAFPAVLLLINIGTPYYTLRWDLTEEKRYTLAPQTRQLLASLDAPLEVILYLNGSLNPSFHRLRSATVDLLTEMSGYTQEQIRLQLVDPSSIQSEMERQRMYYDLNQRGITGLSVNEKDATGKITAQLIFPWVKLVYKGDTLAIPLLRRNILYSSQEVLHSSLEGLEYVVSDGLRVLTLKNPKRIAFIEGHGELTEVDLYESFDLLSRYFQIDRGEINGDPSVLSAYDALVVAGPRSAFSEKEKFALDQYVMQGGSLFLLTEGIVFNTHEFDAAGESATLKRELNLDDLLFTYGVRIEPELLQDLQCTSITVAPSSEEATGTMTLPWYFAPLLVSEPHPLVRSVAPLKSEYVSPLSFVNNRENVRKTVLFSTSDHTHSLPVPEKVSLRYLDMPASADYFNEAARPAVVLIEGNMPSVYERRLLPPGSKELPEGRLNTSKGARLIVAGSASLLRNEWEGSRYPAKALPLGYDTEIRTQWGNEDFLIQSMLYLTGDDEWIYLRERKQTMRLLNREAIVFHRIEWQIANVGFPLVLLFGGMVLFRWQRKKRFIYKKNI